MATYPSIPVGEFHRQRSPWGLIELDMIKGLTLSLFFLTILRCERKNQIIQLYKDYTQKSDLKLNDSIYIFYLYLLSQRHF